MSHIWLEWNNICRELGFKILINAEVSYEEFVKNPIYHQIVDQKDSSCYSALTARWFYSSREIKWLHKYESLIAFFLQYSIKEKFTNLTELKWFKDNIVILNNQIYAIDPSKQTAQNNQDIGCDNENLLHFYIEEIKYYLNHNQMFLNDDICKPITNRKQVSNYRNAGIEFNNSEEDINERFSEISSIVILEQKKCSNRIVDYLYFLTITTTLKLYFVIDPGMNLFYIVDHNSFWKLAVKNMLCVEVSWTIMSTLNQQSQEVITNIKQKHVSKNSNACLPMIEDIIEIMKSNPSVKLELKSIDYGNQIRMDFSIRDQNINNYQKMKEFLQWVPWITKSTAIENYGTQKTGVVATGRIKYWTKKNKTLD